MSHQRWGLGAIAVGTILFGAAIACRDVANPWWSSTAAASVAIALSARALRGRMKGLWSFQLRSSLWAVGLGVFMVTITHVGFSVASGIFPGLERDVAQLYGDLRAATPGAALAIPMIIAIVFAEELLWRGVGVELCRPRLARASTALVATALYTAPQLIGGAWILVAAALLVGAIFTVQRLLTNRVTEPLITHAVWSVAIFGVAPLG